MRSIMEHVGIKVVDLCYWFVIIYVGGSVIVEVYQKLKEYLISAPIQEQAALSIFGLF